MTSGVGPFWRQRLPKLIKEAVELYWRDGRRLEALDEKKLDAGFVAAFRVYAKDQGNRGRSRALNDITAEYVLRRREAPVELLADKLVCIIGLPITPNGLPVVLLACRHVLCIPGWWMILALKGQEANDVFHADLQWLLGCGASERKQEERAAAQFTVVGGRDVA